MLSSSRRYPARPCPVCLGMSPRVLYRQQFGRLSEGSLFDGFDLALCEECGGAYADDIPSQAEFDQYYAEMSKYEYAYRDGMQSESDLARFRSIADLVAPHLPVGARVLDIGCATGGLLAELQLRGWTDLFGVDPSPACAAAVTRLHGIRAQGLSLFALDTLGETFDLIFMTGVLEHLCDLEAALAQVNRLLRPGGLLYVEVPDTTRYAEHFGAPYQFLSMEHVNYFSPVSLARFLHRHGLESVFSQRLQRHLSPKAIEPSVAALFRRTAAPLSPAVHDDETAPALQRYLDSSAKVQSQIEGKIASLVQAGRPLAVWGVGTHTLRLLETSRLREARIVAFLDSNVRYQNKSLAGAPVLAPDKFSDPTVDILISSQVAEEEIYTAIKQQLHWTNPVHRLYPS